MSSPKRTNVKTTQNSESASSNKKTSAETASQVAVLSISAEEAEGIGSWVGKILEFLKGKEEAAIFIAPIDLELAVELQDSLRDTGLKLRLDWRADSNIAHFRMPSRIHSRPLARWLNAIMPNLAATVEELGCRKQFLVNGGDEKITLEDGSYCDPDVGLMISQEKGGLEVCKHRVLIESMASQRHADGKRKAERYLTLSNNSVHAVLLLNFVNRPLKNVEHGAPCKATLEVWARTKSKHPAENFPLDLCGLAEDDASDEEIEDETPDEEDQDDKVLTEEGAQVGQEQQGPNSGETPSIPLSKQAAARNSSEDSWNDDTMVDIEPPVPFPEPDATTTSRVELKESYLVYDETPGAVVDSEMLLDAYYFVRLCRMDPDRVLKWEQRQIKVPLGPLRDAIKTAVAHDRSDYRRAGMAKPLKRKATAGGARADLEVDGPVKKPRATGSGD